MMYCNVKYKLRKRYMASTAESHISDIHVTHDQMVPLTSSLSHTDAIAATLQPVTYISCTRRINLNPTCDTAIVEP